MSILVKCKCGKQLSVKPEMAGKKGKCPGCGALFTIPGPAKPASSGMKDPFDIPFANASTNQANDTFWNELQKSTASATGTSSSDRSAAVHGNVNPSNAYLRNANREAKERERRERNPDGSSTASRVVIAIVGIVATGAVIFGAYSVSTIISTSEFMANFGNSTQTAPAGGGGGGQEIQKKKLSRKFVREHRKLLATIEIGVTASELRQALQVLNQSSDGGNLEAQIMRTYRNSLTILTELENRPDKRYLPQFIVVDGKTFGVWQEVYEQLKEFRGELGEYAVIKFENGSETWTIEKRYVQLFWAKAAAMVKASSDAGD